MANDWTLGTIRTQVRRFSGRLSAGQMANEEVDDKINEFLQNELPGILGVHQFETTFTFTLTTDDGDYDLDADVKGGADVHVIGKPVSANGTELNVYMDPQAFYAKWPTSGEPYTSADVVDVLILGRKLIFRPPPDSDDEASFLNRRTVPAALEADDEYPEDPRWGKLIAAGAAKLIKEEKGEPVDNLITIINEQQTIFGRAKIQQLQEHGTSRRDL